MRKIDEEKVRAVLEAPARFQEKNFLEKSFGFFSYLDGTRNVLYGYKKDLGIVFFDRALALMLLILLGIFITILISIASGWWGILVFPVLFFLLMLLCNNWLIPNEQRLNASLVQLLQEQHSCQARNEELHSYFLDLAKSYPIVFSDKDFVGYEEMLSDLETAQMELPSEEVISSSFTQEYSGLYLDEFTRAHSALKSTYASLLEAKNKELNLLSKSIQSLTENNISLETELGEQRDAVVGKSSSEALLFKKVEKLEDEKKKLSANASRVSKEKNNLIAKMDELTKERDSVYNMLKQTRDNALGSLTVNHLVQKITEWFDDEDAVRRGKKDVDVEAIAAMYAVMHKHYPDKELVHELALIPNELIRAKQKQAVIDHYSRLITKAENDGALSEQEREDIINSYRLAREQELSGEE